MTKILFLRTSEYFGTKKIRENLIRLSMASKDWKEKRKCTYIDTAVWAGTLRTAQEIQHFLFLLHDCDLLELAIDSTNQLANLTISLSLALELAMLLARVLVFASFLNDFNNVLYYRNLKKILLAQESLCEKQNERRTIAYIHVCSYA